MKTFLKFTLWILGIVSLILFLGALIVPQVLFYQHLHEYGWSNDPARWGQYGDFIGGITNPLLSAISIGVLVFLTITVHNNEKKRHQEAIEIEDKRNQASIETQKIVALNQFRHEAYKSLKDHFNNFPLFTLSFLEMSAKYGRLADYLLDYDKFNGYLFKNDKYRNALNALEITCSSISEITESMGKVKFTPEYVFENMHTGSDLIDEETCEKYFELCVQFNHETQDLLNIIQHIMLGIENEFIPFFEKLGNIIEEHQKNKEVEG